MNNFWKILYRVLYFVGVGGAITWVLLGLWAMSGPVQPNPETGQIIGFNIHGTSHYTTQFVSNFFFAMFPLEFGVIATMTGLKWWLRKDHLGKGDADAHL